MFRVVFVGFLGIVVQVLPRIDGAVRFTQVPSSILYVSSGSTAKLVWDYHVDDRNNEFFKTSPQWSYDDGNITTIIASETMSVRPSISWRWSVAPSCPLRLQNRLSKESTATLVITSVTTADNGTYLCQLVLSGGSPLTSRVRLIVTVRPRFNINPPSSMVVTESSNLAVSCTANGQPMPNVTWVKLPDKLTILSQGVGGSILSIQNIRRDQNGTYECQVTNNPNESPLSAQTKVVVHYPPSITIPPKDTLVTEGNDIPLSCYANGNPNPSISWSKSVGIIKTGQTSGNTLTIPNAVKSDAGNYICTARNAYGSATVNLNVIVKYKPSILSKPMNEIVNETESLRLTCSADGYPSPNISWTKSPGTITPSTTNGNVYNIPSVKRSDAGTYTCTASNGIGRNAVTNIQVNVQYKSKIDKTTSTETIDSWNGKHIALRCFFSGNPPPRVTWLKPAGTEISSIGSRRTYEGSVFVSVLNITTTNSEDYGNYRCLVTNLVGDDEYDILVKQLFTPYYPKHSNTISDSKGTEVTVVWCVPDVKGGTPVIDYKVEIDTKSPREVITKDTFATIKELKENTKYVVKVYARNVAGFGDPVSKTFITKNPENHMTFILASLITILVISLLANILFVFNSVRMQRAEKQLRFSKQVRRTAYENKNDVEMEEAPAFAHVPSTNTEVDTPHSGSSGNIKVDDASHYQSLSPATKLPVQASPPQLYQPLHSKGEKDDPAPYASLQLKDCPSTDDQREAKANTAKHTKASVV